MLDMKVVHHHFKTIPSTNDWGKDHISELDQDSLTLITAEEQTEGRGQYGRRWHAPNGFNIYASFCFFIDEDQRDPLSLTHVLAISAIKTLEEHGVICRIKWPNDVMIDHKKIAGILCETIPFSHYFGVVMGLGLNVNMPTHLLKMIDQPATSLAAETGNDWKVEEVIESVKNNFRDHLIDFLKEGFSPFLPRFRQLILLGTREL